MTRTPFRRAGLAAARGVPALFALCCAAAPLSLWAADPLAFIPAEVPMVLAFPRLEQSAERFDEFVRRFIPEFAGFDVNEVQRGFGLPDGVLDTRAPAYLLMMRPAATPRSFVLVFKPSPDSALFPDHAEKGPAIRRLETVEGPCYLAMRDGVAFASLSSRAMIAARRMSSVNSLAAVLSPQERAMLESSDVYVRFSMAAWRDRLSPFVFLASNLVKLGAQSSGGEAGAEALQVLDWFTSGAASVIDQMNYVSAALSYDGRVLRVTHHHVFRAGGSAARYLAQVSRDDFDGLSLLPDQPFFIIGEFGWRVPGESALTTQLTRYVFDLPSIRRKFAEDQRQQLLQATRDCYGRMSGSFIMVSSPPDRLQPIYLLGGYAMKDARKGLEEFRFIQENSGEVLSAIAGSPMLRGFESRTEAGRTVYEMSIDYAGLDSETRRQAVLFYGAEARVQEAVLDEDHIGYITAPPPLSVAALAEARDSGRHVGAQPAVRRILATLPDQHHALILVDLGRCFAVVPWLIQAGLGSAGAASAVPPAATVPHTAAAGPFLAWSGTAGEGSFTGCLVIEVGDAFRAADSLKQMVEAVNGVVTAGGGSPPPPPMPPIQLAPRRHGHSGGH